MERTCVCGMNGAPRHRRRGVIFALNLAEAGVPEAERLVPLIFVVIIGTVVTYGLIAWLVVRCLKLAPPNPQGCLFVGAHPWPLAVASALHQEGFGVLHVDTNMTNFAAARMVGLPTFYASILSEGIMDEIELGGIGRLLALTSNAEISSLAALHFARVFGREAVYQLPPENDTNGRPESFSPHLRGRLLFGTHLTRDRIASHFAAGAGKR